MCKQCTTSASESDSQVRSDRNHFATFHHRVVRPQWTANPSRFLDSWGRNADSRVAAVSSTAKQGRDAYAVIFAIFTFV